MMRDNKYNLSETHEWSSFCLRQIDFNGGSQWYNGSAGSPSNDRAVFLKDFEAKVPRAVEFMLAFAQWKMTR